MSKRKGKLSLLLVVSAIAVASSTMTTYAAEIPRDTVENAQKIQEVIEIIPAETEQVRVNNPDILLVGDYRTRDLSKPTSVWDISTKGQYDFEYEIAGLSYCYSMYNITGVTETVLYCNSATNDNSTSAYGIEVYRNNAIMDTKIAAFDWYTDTDSEKQIRISNMDVDSKYYFKIVPGGKYISGWGYWKEG